MRLAGILSENNIIITKVIYYSRKVLHIFNYFIITEWLLYIFENISFSIILRSIASLSKLNDINNKLRFSFVTKNKNNVLISSYYLRMCKKTCE